MEPKGSLPHSQVPATCPCPEPDQSSPWSPNPTSWRSILILSYLINRDILKVYYKIRKIDAVPWLFLFVCRYVEYEVRGGITNRFEIKVDVWETDLEHLGVDEASLVAVFSSRLWYWRW